MSLLDDVLAANAAHAERSDVPVPPLPEGRRVVVVTCSEIRAPGGKDLATHMGLRLEDVFVVANAGARAPSSGGDVVRSVAAALALGDGGEVFVVAHEDCKFLDADPESIVAMFPVANSSFLAALEALCGESFIAARKLAMASADAVRASPFLPPRTPVHAMVFDRGRGRLSAEQPGYGASAASPSSLGAVSGLGVAPSPILGAPGPTGFGSSGPVSLFGGAPSSLMGSAPPPLVAPPPDMGAGSSFLSPPPPAPRPQGPSEFPHEMAPTVVPSFHAEPLEFKDVPPPPPSRTPAPPPPRAPAPPPLPPVQPAPARSDADEAFRRAQETLERLRRERRR
jgi:carbonic anhydrase